MGFYMKKLKTLIKKFCTKEVILYIVFGVTTTIVNLVVTYLLNHFLNVNGAIASAIGIIAAVLVAYVTNRKMVFNSQAKGFKENLNEFGKFMLGRAGTMAIEQGGVMLFNTLLSFPLMPVKLIFTTLAIILNFFISKFFVFKKSK